MENEKSTIEKSLWQLMLTPETLEAHQIIFEALEEKFGTGPGGLDGDKFVEDIARVTGELYIGKTSALPGDAFFDHGMDAQIFNECFLKATRLTGFKLLFIGDE